jgi:hypothetical protein
VLEVLGNAVDEVVATDVSLLDDASLHQSVLGVRREIDRLLAMEAAFVKAWDDKGVWSDDGSRSAPHRFSRETGLSVPDARGVLHRGRRLATMPLIAAAGCNGLLSSSRVDALVGANRPEVAAAFARDEALLLAMATDLRFDDFRRALRYWAEQANEDDAKDRARKKHESRRAHCSRTFDGTVDLQALFDAVGGEVFMTELRRIEQELFDEEWAEAKAIHGDDVRVEHLRRTPAQRRCDALVEMARRSAGSTAKAKPLISVFVDYDTFTKMLCETATGTVLNPEEVLPLLGEADIERIVFDAPSRVIDVSHKRSFTGALRRAIQVRDRHCQHESVCDVSADKCEGDHILAWSKSGATEQGNGQLLCRFHNRGKGAGPP